jgi:hypothetical protein
MEEDVALNIRHSATMALLLGTLAVAGCATHSPNIADLKYNPGRYYNRTVSVEGVVSNSWGVPLVPFKVYNVQDSTGEVTVVSQSGRVPPRGARVEVRGKVEEFGTFGGRSIGLHIREDHLHVVGR